MRAFEVEASTTWYSAQTYSELARCETASSWIIEVAGDLSDVDGLYALQLYASSGADVLFVMNYPAYMGVQHEDPNFERENPGLGFRYTEAEVLASVHKGTPGAFELLMRERYPNGNLMQAMTDVAFAMVTRVWRECGATGRLFFGIGGINAVNPFSKSAIKNEVAVYAPIALETPHYISVPCKKGNVYNALGERMLCCMQQLLDMYDHIYLDLTGSAAGVAFPSSICANRVRAAVIMNGVHAYEPPLTMPSIPGVLNRMSLSTMNGLYHPQRTGDFYDFCSRNRVPVWAVTNNMVHDLSVAPKDRSTQRLLAFLRANDIEPGACMRAAIELYYGSGYNPPIKAFDAYAAKMLLTLIDPIAGRRFLSSKNVSTLFFDRVFGAALVAHNSRWTWLDALESYCGFFDIQPKDDDTPFERNKRSQLALEASILRAIPYEAISALMIRDIYFQLDPGTMKLAIFPSPPKPIF